MPRLYRARLLPLVIGIATLFGGLVSAASRSEGSGDSRPVVVVAGTVREKAWLAAERRLLAELSLLPVRVKLLPGFESADRQLAAHVAGHGAFAGVQALREGEEGVIRLWLAAGPVERAGYQHARVYLRGVDQVGPAVSEIFERIHGRLEANSASSTVASESQPSEPVAGSRVVSQSSQGAHVPRLTAPYESPIAPPARHGLLIGAGPWFSGRDAAPGFSLTGRYRYQLSSDASTSFEAFYHLLHHELTRGEQEGTARLFGARWLAIWHPWPRARVRVGLGAGASWIGLAGTGAVVEWSQALGVVARLSLSAPVRPGLALGLLTTSTWRLPNPQAVGGPPFRFSTTGFDGQVAAEWQWD